MPAKYEDLTSCKKIHLKNKKQNGKLGIYRMIKITSGCVKL